jgi:hypothetical protein
LAGDFVRVVGEAAGGDGGGVDHRDHAVDRQPVAHGRPVEGFEQGFRQREAGGFDQDVLGRVGAIEQRLHGRQEILGDGAAQAAIGEFDDVVIGAAGDAAAAQGFAVDAQRAEFIDDDGDAAAAGVGEHVAQQGGFAGAEEAGDDGGGDFAHTRFSGAGTRPIMAAFSAAGRREGISAPVGEAA